MAGAGARPGPAVAGSSSQGLATVKIAWCTCCTISRTERWRSRPICAVSQKRQPIAQPTWLLTQSVRLNQPVRCGIGITTLSVS